MNEQINEQQGKKNHKSNAIPCEAILITSIIYFN